MQEAFSIGQVAKAVGIGVETVRFYERQGLIADPARRPSGYRIYESDAVDRLRFIRRAKALGFSLKEIADLLELKVDATSSAHDVKALTESKIADIDRRIAELHRMRDALAGLAEQCTGTGTTHDCPILAAIADEPTEGERPS